MKKIYSYLTLLSCLMLFTGCQEDQSPVSVVETQSITESVEIETAQLPETITLETIPETSRSDADSLSELYTKYSPAIETVFSTYYAQNQEEYVSIEEALQEIDSDYDKALKSLESTYQKVYSDCTPTSAANFIPEYSFQPVSGYDPMTAVLYHHQSEINVNPIELMSKLVKTSELYEKDNPDYLEMQNWYAFNRTYDFVAEDLSEKSVGVPHETYLLNQLSEYLKIPEEELQIGYSHEEQLYYCYLVDTTSRDYGSEAKNLEVTALYFQFDEEHSAPVRCGVEIYVRTTDFMRQSMYSVYSYTASHFGFRNFFSKEWIGRDGIYDVELLDMMDWIMPATHSQNCRFALKLLTNGDPDMTYTSENLVHFDVTSDFRSMSRAYYINGGHFVTWFSLE